MPDAITVETLAHSDVDNWDAYVRSRTDASFFHLSGWRGILESALGHKAHYYVAKSSGKIVGILPLVHVKSLMFGNSLSSLAFGAYGGTIADNTTARDLLDEQAVALGRELRVGTIEFRLREASGKGRPTKELYERFVKPVLPDEDENMKAIRGKQRNVIRKGMKNGLEARIDTVEIFYNVYAESVRNLGTPVFPIKLFQEMVEAFPDHTEVITVALDDKPISSALVYYHGDEVCPYYWGGTFAARGLKGNDVLAWKIMCRAAERGCSSFDFGRSKRDTGPYQWKLNLGFEPLQLYYEYELINENEIPNVNPLNPKYRLFIEAWKRLPLGVSKLIGPIVSRSLG